MRPLFLLLLFVCVGCVQHPAIATNEAIDLPGIYQNGDGFWPRWLELKEDGTFSYTQITDVLKQAADGSMVFEGGWGLAGRWSFHPPDRIEMLASGRTEKISVFVRRSAKHQFAILEPDLFPNILKRWKDDGSWGYLKKAPKWPNKAPEPTPTSVTSPADAGAAPAAVVAHL